MRPNGLRFEKALRSAPAIVALALLASLVCALPGGADPAQDAETLSALNQQIVQLKADGKADAAIALAEKYVHLARKIYGGTDPEYATAITWLGSLYQSEKRYADAEPLLEEAISIREQAFGPDNLLVATSLYNLAGLYQKQGREDDAAPLIARAETIKASGSGTAELDALARQLEALKSEGEADQAARVAARYLALAKERYGADQPGVIPALLAVASLYQAVGDTAKAEALLKEALSIRERVFGPDSVEAADTLDTLATLYREVGRDKEAVPLLERTLAIRKAALGEKSREVVDTLKALSGAYLALGRTAEADETMASALALQKELPRRRVQAPQESEPSYAVVKVFYATDRKDTGAADPVAVYGGDRGPLTFGTATVSIPRDHRMGALETPSVWRLEWSNDPDRFVVLLSVTESDEAAFFKDIQDRVKSSRGKSAFVFVHGYNVTFADAARRTAQMTYDLGFDGAPVFYSWPSQAEYAAYKVDETNAEWAKLDFEKFLKDFVAQSGAEHIYLVAHSMGTRVLTGALKELVLADPSMRETFDEIILAAPDIDAETFERDIAPKILDGERAATLYASSGDYALMASKTFAGYRRAGDTAGGITIAPGVDTIDASALKTDFVGHSYYGDSGSVLGDLRDLILTRKRAEKRKRLSTVTTEKGRYWTFTPEAPAPAP